MPGEAEGPPARPGLFPSGGYPKKPWPGAPKEAATSRSPKGNRQVCLFLVGPRRRIGGGSTRLQRSPSGSAAALSTAMLRSSPSWSLCARRTKGFGTAVRGSCFALHMACGVQGRDLVVPRRAPCPCRRPGRASRPPNGLHGQASEGLRPRSAVRLHRVAAARQVDPPRCAFREDLAAEGQEITPIKVTIRRCGKSLPSSRRLQACQPFGLAAPIAQCTG